MEVGGLPANVLSNLLKGFGHANNQDFKQLCNTQLSVTKFMPAEVGKSKKQQIFRALSILDTEFIDLSTGSKWTGVGHSGTAFKANFQAFTSRIDQTQSYKQWVEKRDCYICGEEGHLARNCPHKDRQRQKRERRRDYGRQRRQDNAGIDGEDKAKAERKQRRFDKVFAAALKQVEECQSGSESEAEKKANIATEEPEDSGAESDNTSDSDGLRAHALRMYDALRE